MSGLSMVMQRYHRACYSGVYSTFTTVVKIRKKKTVGHFDPQTVYVHKNTLENSRKNNCNKVFRPQSALKKLMPFHYRRTAY